MDKVLFIIIYRCACEDPSQAAEDEGFKQPQYVQHIEPVNSYAVAREVNGECAVDGHTCHEQKEPHSEK